MEVFGDEPEVENEMWDDRLQALKECRGGPPSRGAMLLALFYDQGLSVQRVGERLGMKTNAVKQAISRVRRSLQILY